MLSTRKYFKMKDIISTFLEMFIPYDLVFNIIMVSPQEDGECFLSGGFYWRCYLGEKCYMAGGGHSLLALGGHLRYNSICISQEKSTCSFYELFMSHCVNLKFQKLKTHPKNLVISYANSFVGSILDKLKIPPKNSIS